MYESWRVFWVYVSPLTTLLDDVRAAERMKFPLLEASHIEMCVRVSVAVIDQLVGEADRLIDPPDAAEKLALFRVVFVDAFAVPADPGSPVWSWM